MGIIAWIVLGLAAGLLAPLLAGGPARRELSLPRGDGAAGRVRTVKTAAGATAVQIVYSWRAIALLACSRNLVVPTVMTVRRHRTYAR